MMLHNVNKNQV